MQFHSSPEVEVWRIARPYKDLELRLPFGHLSVQVALAIRYDGAWVAVLEVPDAITFGSLLVLVPNQSLDVRYCMFGEDSVVVPFPIHCTLHPYQRTYSVIAEAAPNREATTSMGDLGGELIF